TEWRTALATFRELVRDRDLHKALSVRSQVAWVLFHLGPVLYRAGKPSEAEAEYREAGAIWQKLSDDHPKDPEDCGSLACGLTGWAAVLRRGGRTAEARDAADRAVALREALVREDPRFPMYSMGLASSLHSRAMARLALGDTAGAAVDARRALALWDAVPW